MNRRQPKKQQSPEEMAHYLDVNRFLAPELNEVFECRYLSSLPEFAGDFLLAVAYDPALENHELLSFVKPGCGTINGMAWAAPDLTLGTCAEYLAAWLQGTTKVVMSTSGQRFCGPTAPQDLDSWHFVHFVNTMPLQGQRLHRGKIPGVTTLALGVEHLINVRTKTEIAHLMSSVLGLYPRVHVQFNGVRHASFYHNLPALAATLWQFPLLGRIEANSSAAFCYLPKPNDDPAEWTRPYYLTSKYHENRLWLRLILRQVFGRDVGAQIYRLHGRAESNALLVREYTPREIEQALRQLDTAATSGVGSWLSRKVAEFLQF